MDPARWNKVSQIFHAARQKPESERQAFLLAECGADGELLEEVQQLVAADVQADSMLANVVADAASQLDEAMEGSKVGAYRIIRELGRGGMGRVFLAERDDGEFEQQVALKLVRRGMDSDQILQRFRQERQILARLHHPNIARLVDGGVTEGGQPYFALEYVDGKPIDEYSSDQNLSVDEKLDLFSQVCDALIYAHSNLVIHRDLKPDNILTTPDGQIRLLDFGIAKVLAEEGRGTALTHTGSWVMTPAYASPEQARGEHIGTSSDVYSLGVILYELLTGVRPYEVDSRSPTEVERVICTTEPQRPSSRIASDGTSRQADSRDRARLKKRLVGDLDVICLKALRKEPERRYGSVEALLEDIRRHRKGLPILARPDTVSYRIGKAARRHPVAVTATTGIAVLIAALVTFYTVRVSAERDRAQLEANKAGEVVAFMRGLFEVSDPSESLGETVTARELLDEGALRIDEGLEGQPEVQAEMRHLIGSLYGDLGLPTRGVPLLERAVEQYRELLGHDNETTALAEVDLATLYQDSGDHPAAEPLFRKGLATLEELYGAQHPLVNEARQLLAYWLETNGEYAAAGEEFRRALDGMRSTLPLDDDRVLESMVQLGRYLRQHGDRDGAELLLRESLVAQKQKFGDLNLEVASTARNLASLLRDKGEFAEADSLFQQVLSTRKQILGDIHGDVANTLNSYAIMLDNMGETERAIPVYREMISIYEAIHRGPHPDLAAAYNNVARSLRDAGRSNEAIAAYEESLAIQDSVLRPDHPNRAIPLQGLAITYRQLGDDSRAERLFREALAIRRMALPPGHRYIGESLADLASLLIDHQRYAEAEPLLTEAYGMLVEGQGADDGRTRRARRLLISLYDAWGMPDRAASYRAEETPG